MPRKRSSLLPLSKIEDAVNNYSTANIQKEEMLEILSAEIRKTRNLNAAKLYCDLQGWTKTTIKDIPQINLSFGSETVEAIANGEDET